MKLRSLVCHLKRQLVGQLMQPIVLNERKSKRNQQKNQLHLGPEYSLTDSQVWLSQNLHNLSIKHHGLKIIDLNRELKQLQVRQAVKEIWEDM